VILLTEEAIPLLYSSADSLFPLPIFIAAHTIMDRGVILLAETIIKAMLVFIIVLLAILALNYLHKRALPPAGYVFWAVIALTLPVFGPILLISIQPGEPRQIHDRT